LYGELLEDLHKNKKIIRQQNGSYIIDTVTQFVVGRVDHVNARFAFIVVEDREDDIWVNTRELNGAVDGDTVKVLVFQKVKKAQPEPKAKL